MPCDAAATCGIEMVDSSTTIADAGQRSETERINARKKRRQLEISSKPANRYKIASRPMDVATNSSASCSSSSSSSSSTSSSCYERPRQNDSTNSSSSLILILERPETSEDTSKNGKMVEHDKAITSNEDNEDDFDDSEKNEGLARVSSSGGFSSKVTSSSIENLAKKKAATTRCRRKRSTASPRTNRNSSIIIDDTTLKLKNTSFEMKPLAREQQHDPSGFVATSTLTKNSDCNGLLISRNASRSAAKLKLQSSCGDSSTTRNYDNYSERNFDQSRREAQNVDPHGKLKSQQSTISVAAIRATNVALESRHRKNYEEAVVRIVQNLTSVPRYGSAYASAPSLNNNSNIETQHDNHKNQEARTNRQFSSHSPSTRLSNVVPLAVVSTRPLSSSPSQQHTSTSAISKKNKKTSETVKTCGMQLQGPVKSSPSYVLSSTRDLSRGSTTVGFANSLKSSSSFTAPKAMRKNRNSRVITSLHASLGQLPITTTSSCATSATATTIGEAASDENLKDFATPRENNEKSTFVPITLYSTNSSPGETKNSSLQAKNSLERISHVNGGSTSSSSFTKTPLRIVPLPEVGNSPNNVANSFRNNLVASGYNYNNINNNNNANLRCNHLVGTCACSATMATSQTSSTLTRTSNIANGIATSSSWSNNSVEQETDYVVDPVQGNAYHKGQFLGKGGFARVYLMTDVANGKQYACKIIPKNRMQKIHIQKIAREIMIHKELNHVNVVQMHHYFEDNINVYMLLEPCPRKSLMHVLKYRGKVTEPEARYYMRQMVTGVAYIHSQKVVHRDLKPGNMFLSDGMIVKIGDFGLATRPDGQRRRVTICGTPNYIAPEVLYKQAYSYEADVWALGCILYALLAGQPPFDTSTLKQTYARICNNRYKKLDDSVVSRSGQDLISWLLQPIPELRPSLERVKEHAYLTMEYVPSKLSHTCCYKIPITNSLVAEQSSTMVQQQIGTSLNSAILRGVLSHENIDRKYDPPAGNLSTKNPLQISNVTASQIHLDPSKNVALTKKPKVGNWLFRKLPKLPRFRQRLSKLLCPEHKKPDSLMMHRAIESCLADITSTRAQHNPILVDRITPLFVTKWIDYSNKYGLGFQLSDRSVGVLFNDSTKMSYTHDRRRVEYATTEDEVTRYRTENDVPSSMEEKLELLRHFTHYMDNFLTNGGEVREPRTTKFSRTSSSSVPRMRRWLRTDKAIVMELTVPLLQVNFFVDHSKIVVSEGTRGRGYLVTYIDASRQASSYWLNDLRDIGCTTDLYERLSYVSKVTAEFENDAIFETATNFLQNRTKTLKT